MTTFTWQNGVCGLGGPWGKPDVGGHLVREELKEKGPGAPAAFSTRSRLLSGEMGKKRGESALRVDTLASGSALGRVPRTVGADKRPPSESPGRQTVTRRSFCRRAFGCPWSRLPTCPLAAPVKTEAPVLAQKPGDSCWSQREETSGRVWGCRCVALERASLNRE